LAFAFHETSPTKHTCAFSGNKWYFVFPAALAASDFGHFSIGHSFRFPFIAAIGTSKWRIVETFLGIEFLLTGSPNKLISTIFTN
jgi:hypothetical protein